MVHSISPKMKTEKEVEELCKKLKPIIGKEADQLWYMYLAEDENDRRKRNIRVRLRLFPMLVVESLLGTLVSRDAV